MKKDIFIDTNIAKDFTNPINQEYIKLIDWLLKYEEGSENNAFLAVSKKLLSEYFRSAMNAHTKTCIQVIISQLQIKGRLLIFTNEQIKEFQKKYFSKKVIRNLRCNQEDRNHIPIVLLSERKYALSKDNNFTYDLLNFPGFSVRVEQSPERLNYEN